MNQEGCYFIMKTGYILCLLWASISLPWFAYSKMSSANFDVFFKKLN